MGPGLSFGSLLRIAIPVLGQAQHERKTPVKGLAMPFVLRFSKDERSGFQPTARRSIWLGIAMTAVSVVMVIHPAVSQAQTTNITSSGLNTTVHAVNPTTIAIDGGTRPGGGSNLFHSFGQFSIGEGHTALFRNSDSGATSNIFGRVTGGSISNIFGTIDTVTNFPTANLWLINPNGFLFGQTAVLNVGGSVNISTADYLKMADGKRFNALPGPADALLSMASVEAFGFLERPTLAPTFGKITISGTNTNSSPLASLSLVGREIVLTGANLDVSGGGDAPKDILVASMSSRGEIRLRTPSSGPQISPSTALGPITLENSRISSGSSEDFKHDKAVIGVPTIRFFGDTVTMRNSVVESALFGPNADSGSIEFNLTDRLIVEDGSFLRTTNIASNGTDIVIRAPVVELKGGSVTTAGDDFSTGGMIHISGRSVKVTDGLIAGLVRAEGGGRDVLLNLTGGLFLGQGGRILAEAGAGGGGAIIIQAPVVDITGGSIRIATDEVARPIQISGGTVRIKNGEISTAFQGESMVTPGPNNIEFNLTGDLVLESGGRISTNAFENIPGGAIQIRAGSVDLRGGRIEATSSAGLSIFGGTFGEGSAGKITIHAENGIRVTGGAIITSEFTWIGKAGDVVLNAGHDIRIENGKITSAALPADPDVIRNLDESQKVQVSQCTICVGTAGNIRLNAGHDIQVRNGQIATTSVDGSGGNIKLTAPNTIFIANSTISSSVKGQKSSNGGNISIDPVAVAIQNSQILAQANAGAGGNITIAASGSLLVSPSSVLDASAGSAGVSGSVNINAPIQVLGGTLVPLKVSYSQPALSGDRCAADPQGRFSSFVQTGRDRVPPIPGGFAPSPLVVLDQLVSSERDAQPLNLTARRLGLDSVATSSFHFQSACRS